MEDEMLKMCKKVAYYGEIPDAYCHKIIEIGCNNCPFAPVDCGKNYKTVQEIAQKYIKEHEKTVNTIEKIEEKITLKELQEIKKDNIIPTYYHQGNYDVIQFCIDNNIDFVSGNIIKYITRYKGKNGLEDLKKAQEYLRRLKESKITVFKEDLANFCDENNMTYTQGKIVECIITNDKDTAEVLIKELIRKEEKKIKEIEETYEAEGMAD